MLFKLHTQSIYKFAAPHANYTNRGLTIDVHIGDSPYTVCKFTQTKEFSQDMKVVLN